MTKDGQSAPAVRNRNRIDLFKRNGHPSVFSISDMNKLVAAINALMNPQIVWGESDGVDIADANTTIRLSRATASTAPAGGGGASLSMFRLKSVQDDYVTCRTWDGVTDGSTDMFLVKEWKVRTSLTSESVLGVTHNYTYGAGPDGNNLIRTNNDGTNAQPEIITPPWSVNEVIFAVSGPTDLVLPGPGGAAITFLLIGRSAEWAKISPLAVLPATPADSSDSTTGYTAGLIVADGSYIYVSTGLNTWKRVAITTW